MTRLPLSAAALALILTGCTGDTRPPPGPVVPPTETDSCGAAQYAGLIGQDATALERVLILGQVRVIRPGDAVTMDYRPERINFEIDAGERIARITCG